jgi:RNA ligase
MIPFPSIVGFHNVVRFADAFPEAMSGPVCYRGKIKLHGTNCAVTISNGELEVQSRSTIITPTDDHCGFAKFVEAHKDFFLAIPTNVMHHPDVPHPTYAVFGEWCGQGIQGGTAISEIGKKVFAVFAILAHKVNTVTGEDVKTLITDPDNISGLLGLASGTSKDDVHVIPWIGDRFFVNYKDKAELLKVADRLNKVVQEVEPCDPWVKMVFGVEGTGEGVVFYPNAGESIDIKKYEELAFKAKGDKHKVVKTKDAVQVSPEVAASVDAFVAMFVTEPRLEQGLAASGGVATMKNIGAFLKWMATDIYKE